MNVQETDAARPRDRWLSPQEIAQIQQALQNEAYPPAGRTSVGTVLRRGRWT